jgi:U4/U6.U5 tri-snRNP-associated protein 2
MRIYTRKIPPIELEEEQKEALLLMDEYQEKVTESPFLYLTCDLPPPPLFKDEFRENIIPQVRTKHQLHSALVGLHGTYIAQFLSEQKIILRL